MERPPLGGEGYNEMELVLDSPILIIFTKWSFLYFLYRLLSRFSTI